MRPDQGSVGGTWRGAPGSSGGSPMVPVTAASRGVGRGGFTPTVASLLILIGLELAAYVGLRYAFRIAHGG